MTSEWKKLSEYFQQHADVELTSDAADPHVIEDPRDKSNIMAINMLIRRGTSEEKLKDTAKTIQGLLDQNGITAVACTVEGAANCTGIHIMSEQPLPKSLGIRSEFNGVPVGFTIVESLAVFKRKPASPKGPAA
jgi:hypothetical protein